MSPDGNGNDIFLEQPSALPKRKTKCIYSNSGSSKPGSMTDHVQEIEMDTGPCEGTVMILHHINTGRSKRDSNLDGILLLP